MYEDYGTKSQIVNQPGLEGPPFSDQEMWFAQYDQGPSGAAAILPIHMRSNPFMVANPTQEDYDDPSPWKAPVTWWGNQSTTTKVLVGGGAATVIGLAAYFLLKKK